MKTPRLGVALAGFAAMMLTVTGAASTASAHELHSQGSPTNIASGHADYYVWHDGHDIHLDVASGDNSATIRGKLHTDGTFHDLSQSDNNQDFHASISDDRHTIKFHGSPGANLNDLKVRVEDSNVVHVKLYRNGGKASTDQIWVGQDDEHPSHSSFTLHL
ncbi:MAG: hypothetical protein IT305_04125 [Chloroflexi bacterium]|nr:hypothetical protein [Chloroflexota bacterium]